MFAFDAERQGRGALIYVDRAGSFTDMALVVPVLAIVAAFGRAVAVVALDSAVAVAGGTEHDCQALFCFIFLFWQGAAGTP